MFGAITVIYPIYRNNTELKIIFSSKMFGEEKKSWRQANCPTGNLSHKKIVPRENCLAGKLSHRKIVPGKMSHRKNVAPEICHRREFRKFVAPEICLTGNLS